MRFSDTLKQYALITVSCALYALGFCWCCQPQHMSIGGLTGVAQVLNVFFPALPVGTVTLVLNVPVFILGWKLLGGKVLVSSLYAMAVSSLMIDGINAVHQFQPLEPVLAVVMTLLATRLLTVTVFGMIVGAAFAHNFGLAGNADAMNETKEIVVGGISTNGKVAVCLGILIMLGVSLWNMPKKAAVSASVEAAK